MNDNLNPYPGNLKHYKVDTKNDAIDIKALTGHSLSDLTDAGVFCFINEQFPIIASASREDLSEPERSDKRFPIVHAVLKKRNVDGMIEFYVSFEKITSIPPGEELDYKCPHVEHVTNELLKFVVDTYANKFKFEINGEFYHVSDMRGTLLNRKYTLLPAL